ncbi:MAG: SDR family NAD(P)-dependent oxidoreductase, partial [Novosphingobium sp.]
MLDFKGRVAVITGAGQGLGRSYALVLAARGARILVNDLPEFRPGKRGLAAQVANEITTAGGIAVACEGSVVTEAARIVQAAIDSFGQLDILINNAGSTHHRMFEDLSDEEFKAQIDVHLGGGVAMCRAALPHLKRSGTGKIVNTISSGIFGNSAISNYTAGKGGLLGFSRSFGLEALAHNIHLNCVFPNGSTRLQWDMAEAFQSLLKAHFMPDRVAAFVAWLVHQDTKVANEMFEVGGGAVARLAFAHFPYVQAGADSPE